MLDKEKRKNLNKLVVTFHKNITDYKKKENNYNEQMTRQQYIDNFLKILDWDVSNSKGLSFSEREIVVEEYSKINKKDRPDYTIRMNGVSKFHIEAKKVSVAIEKDIESVLQVRRYGWNSGHDIAILTNFEYLIIYLTYEMPLLEDKVNKFRYKIYSYEEYEEKIDEIYSLISRESLVNGDFDKWIKNIRPENATKKSLDSIFLSQLNNWRVIIANNLLKNHSENVKKNNINEMIQIFLNQIIFLRFAEDNRFENSNLLREEILKYKNYIDYFKFLDKKYNSGLFKNSFVIENLDYNILVDIVESLYFPNTSYDFSIIDLSILSKIYENFLQEELIIKENLAYLVKTKSAKIKSIISTPNSMVIAMVNNLLKDRIKGKSPEELFNIKIGDLAIGSGIFLIEAFNFIERYLIDWYSIQNNVTPNFQIVPFIIKKQVVEKMLFGFDINDQAVQITKFSILLRLLSNEEKERIENIIPILPDLENNIICGNSLINENEIDIDNLSKEEFLEIIPLDMIWGEEKKFDIILGNPPYLQTKEIEQSTSKKEIELYKKIYISAAKQYDKYFLFLERIFKFLKENGEALLLVPNKFLVVGAGKKLRNFLIKNGKIRKIYDFGVEQIFNDVTNYVAVVHLSNDKNDRLEYIEVESFKDIYYKKSGIEYKINELDDEYLFLTSDLNLKKQYNLAIKNFPNILEEIEVKNGIQTSCNSVFVIEKKDIIFENDKIIKFIKKHKEYEVEKKILKKYFQGFQNISGESYLNINTNANDYIIFPYHEKEIISKEILEIEYPKLWKYLNEYKDKLLPKYMGGKRDVQGSEDKNAWYQYGRRQFLSDIDKTKIIVGVLSNKPNFNIDRNNFIFSSGGTAGHIGIYLKENSKYTLEYIQAWLSHHFTDTIFKIIGSGFEGGFYSHGTGLYKGIPLLPIDFNDLDEVKIFNKINNRVKLIEELNKEIDESYQNYESEKKKRIKLKKMYIKNINEYFDKLLIKKMEE